MVDGVIPGSVLAAENLTLAPYTLPDSRNTPREDPLREESRRVWVGVY